MTSGAHPMTAAATPRVLQFCHGYDGPFLDCARQYASLFAGTPYAVTTVYLTGAPDEAVARGSASDEVIFLDYRSRDVRGLKLKAIADLRRLLRGRDVRLCIAHRFKPVYVALLGSRLPVIGVHHAFGDYHRLSRRVFAGLFRRRLSLLGVSDAVRDDLRASLPGWPAPRIETLHNRLDATAARAGLLARDEARRGLGLPPDAWVVGNVGRLHPDKDQATLIRAFARALPNLPPASVLAIMGSGRLEGELKALAAREGVAERVRFLGQVPDGRRYFRAFDLFALSSDHEPFGMVLLEAMAADVPVVATACGGAPEVLDDAGALFPLGDATTLAERLARAAIAPPEALAAIRERQARRLDACFSDAAARQRFWSLPMTLDYR